MSVADIKKMLKDENLIIGSDRVLRMLRSGELEKVYLSSNAPKVLSEDVERYSGMGGVTLERLDIPNDELGVAVKKPFSISCIGIKKAGAKKKR